ncbi:MAG: LarC family nickel insertion protein [Veillonellaceae bacterium]|nr:LarC family nickel insertion protein [Veillonellaceae bacterium]
MRMRLLEANLDDMTPEVLAHVQELLLAAGAADAWQEPIVMKKGRSGIKLCALCAIDVVPRLQEIFLRETSTWGVRILPAERVSLTTDFFTVELAGEPIRIKYARWPGGVKCKPELDDCLRAAEALQRPLAAVIQDAQEKGKQRLYADGSK